MGYLLFGWMLIIGFICWVMRKLTASSAPFKSISNEQRLSFGGFC